MFSHSGNEACEVVSAFDPLPLFGLRCYSVPVKKGHGLKRALQPMSREQLEALPTGTLLARLKRLRWCEESADQCDLSEAEIASVSHLILFKTDTAWRGAYADLKEVLAAREHLSYKP